LFQYGLAGSPLRRFLSFSKGWKKHDGLEKALLVQFVGSFLVGLWIRTMQFELSGPFKISPGQEKAVDQLVNNFATKSKQTLLLQP
jgi:hypothetical protein